MTEDTLEETIHKHIQADNLTTEEFGLNGANEYLSSVHVTFTSPSDRHYKAVHVLQRLSKKRPYILLTAEKPMSITDYMGVITILEKTAVGWASLKRELDNLINIEWRYLRTTPTQRLFRMYDITERGDDFSRVIHPTGKMDSGTILKFIRVYQHFFDDVTIAKTHFRNVPDHVYKTSSRYLPEEKLTFS